MEKEESIDLGELLKIGLYNKKRIFAIIALCTGLAMVTAFFILPKTYESSVLVRAKSTVNTMGGAAMEALGIGGGAASPVQGYIEMMKSRTVIEPIIAKVDMDEEVREKMTTEGFVKGRLEIKNTKGTDLIEITAKSKSPDEAKMIAEDVVNGFLSLMTKLNQTQQSSVMKFLADRIGIAKQEKEDAMQKLEAFRQQEKMFSPGDQAKAVMEKMMAYDKAIGDLNVSRESGQAKLQSIVGQLQKQNMALQEFNITDNESIQKIRDNIIQKQINLIELEQRYTEKHPNVQLQKQEIEELTVKLRKEVSDAVQAGTSTLNPVHAGLLAEKVQTETGLMVSDTSLKAIETERQKAETDISSLSTKGVEYVKLERQAGLTQVIYDNLVKNYEDTRIQEAMESMDIQIIDPANYPKIPAGPRKLLITAIGGVIGVVFAFAYVMLLYSRKEKY